MINAVFLVLSTKVSLKDNSQQINPEKGTCWIKTFFCDFSPLVNDELGILKNSLKFFNKLSKGWNSPKGTRFLLSYLSFVEVLTIEVKIFSSCWIKKPPIISISANSVLAWKFGHLPKVGESFEDYDLRFTVTSADQRKIKKITVRKID